MDAEEPREVDALLEFLFRLGQAYIGCGEQTAQVELILRRIAAANGTRRSRVVTFPTAIFITLHDGVQERVTLSEGPLEPLRLDQMADVYALGAAAQRGEVTPSDGLERLGEILQQAPRFGAFGAILGHVILTVGLAMLLAPALEGLAAAAVLGAIVGALKVLNRNRPVFAMPLPVVSATLVSALVFLAADRGLGVQPIQLLIPPLVTFLPGGMLTMAMVELAYGDMISGTTRLVTGFVQLVFLAFGLAAGATLVGYDVERLLSATRTLAEIPWIPWLGVLLFGIGVHVHFSAPRNSLVWMLVVLFVVFAVQRVASDFVRSDVSGFFGMLVATPLGYLVQLRFKGPPAVVTFLPSFWVVVPGSLGLVSVASMLSDRDAGIDGLVTVMIVLVSVALGTLVGAGLYKSLTETFGAWQLQIGRALRKKP
ncbi:MAG: threonine/serine exporter family protein [Myxococcota bacterium]|nr:threonine/serine exporter family protein [Myxococcota bacterium]